MLKLTQDRAIEPVFKENAVPICFSANNTYIPQTAVMIRSIVDNAVDERNYDIIILSTDIDEINEKNVVDMSVGKDNVSIRIFDITSLIDNVRFFTDSVYTPTTYSKEAYFRLFIPYAMPSYDKVVYFDGDMTAAADVSPIMDIDMTDYVGAATRDYCGIAACYDPGSDREAYRREIGIKKQDNYFISSMVVINIHKFTELYTLEFVKSLISSRAWRQHDQDILNVLCQDYLLIVDAKWSYFEEFDYSFRYLSGELKSELLEAQKSPCVVHYAGANKAWNDDRSPMTSYFWKSARRTPYFNEFFEKISRSNVEYRYRIISDFTEKTVDYYYDGADVVLCSTPHFVGRFSNLKVCVEFMSIKDRQIFVEGYFETVDALGALRLYATLNGKRIDTYNSETYRRLGKVQNTGKMRDFRVCASLDMSLENNMLGFVMSFDDKHFISPSYVSVEQFAPINEYGYSFCSLEDFIVTKQEGVRFEVAKHSRKKILDLNRRICRYLRSKKEKYFTKMARVRWLYYFTKPLMRKKNIWLVSGTDKAIDECTLRFFEYLKKQNGISAYLVVGENDGRYSELKKLGNVIRARSKKHKFKFLHAKTVVASEYNLEFFMPMYSRSNEVRDMIANKKFVYWHDGSEDLSYNMRPWYNVYKFIFPNKEHYEFMKNYDNGYSEKHLMVAEGMPDDKLFEQIFNQINED